MKKKLLSAFLALFSLVAINAWAADPTTELTGLLSEFNSMTAQFSQVVYSGKGKVVQRSSGTMALQRPGKFRWQVSEPNAQLLIADGSDLWVYDVVLNKPPDKSSSKVIQTARLICLAGQLTASPLALLLLPLMEKQAVVSGLC